MSWISPKYEQHLVSVIIPTYNRDSLLKDAVKSVFDQTYRPIECLIVDDGSTDDTKNQVELLIKEYNNAQFQCRYIFQKNSGAPSARNNGTEHASGEYIQYLDSDDILYPDKIKTQIQYLSEHLACDGVFGNWEKGTQDRKEIIMAFKSEDIVAQFYGGRVIANMSFLFRRTIVNRIGKWDENLKRNQEMDFNLRGVLVGGQFDYINHITALWREHPGERIANTNGTRYALQYHEKWIKKLEHLGLLSQYIKEMAASHLFYKALDLPRNESSLIVKNLKWALELNPAIPSFNTKKMVFFRKLLSIKLCLYIWLLWERKNR